MMPNLSFESIAPLTAKLGIHEARSQVLSFAFAVMYRPNPAFKRDAAEARRPLTFIR